MARKPLLWILAVVVALVAGWQLAPAQGEKERAVQKWEYKAIDGGQSQMPHARHIGELAKLGDDGWELVAVEPATTYVQASSAAHSNRVFHLKRPK